MSAITTRSIASSAGRYRRNTTSNWTHANTLGRILIKIGVDYDSDPEQVRQILAECAADHPQVLKVPPPVVLTKVLAGDARKTAPPAPPARPV